MDQFMPPQLIRPVIRPHEVRSRQDEMAHAINRMNAGVFPPGVENPDVPPALQQLMVIVQVASTANVASLSGNPTIDGITLGVNSMILLKNQTTATQNGVWLTPRVAGGNWTFLGQIQFVLVASGTLSGFCAYFLRTTNTYQGLEAFYG